MIDMKRILITIIYHHHNHQHHHHLLLVLKYVRWLQVAMLLHEVLVYNACLSIDRSDDKTIGHCNIY